jgi:zinc transporter, ZIP family
MDQLVRWIGAVLPGGVLQGLAGGVVITVFNMVGALLVLPLRNVSEKFLDVSLGFAAGVMLSASFTSLILPGIEYGGVIRVIAGIALGAVMLHMADRFIPHTHAVSGIEGARQTRIRGVWLFIIAITLHNMPEGLAVGVGFGSGNVKDALLLMLAIGIQNLPEGLVVSLSAVSVGMGTRWYAALVGIRAGLVELPLAILGAWAVSAARGILPYAMGFAAGAMLYVISDEIIPETHRKGHERAATMGILVGVCLMLFLDVTLG